MAPTFGEVLQKFIVRCEERGLEPATLKSYRYFIRSFLEPELGDIPVTDLRIVHFEDLYQCMTLAKYDPSTIKKLHTLAGSALKYAERHELVNSNVARLAETPKSRRPVRNIPTAEQMRTFLDFARTHDPLMHDYAWVMSNTGASTDLSDDNILTIQRALDVSTGSARIKGTKTGKDRRIFIDDETAAIIRRRNGEFVFDGAVVMRSDIASKRWHRLAARIDLSFTPRSCRHFHASQLIGAGHSTKDVAERLGHSNSLITETVYIEYIEARGAALSGSVADVLDRTRVGAAA